MARGNRFFCHCEAPEGYGNLFFLQGQVSFPFLGDNARRRMRSATGVAGSWREEGWPNGPGVGVQAVEFCSAAPIRFASLNTFPTGEGKDLPSPGR